MLEEGALGEMLGRIGLPQDWAQELKDGMILRRAAPGEGVIREGDRASPCSWSCPAASRW
ncbi:MAG: hypothetical protein ABSH53_03260 [Holophaga sp.]